MTKRHVVRTVGTGGRKQKHKNKTDITWGLGWGLGIGKAIREKARKLE